MPYHKSPSGIKFLSNYWKWNKFSPSMFMLLLQGVFDIEDTDEDGK